MNVRTRKRNIVIPVDPGSFADALIQIVTDSFEPGKTLSEDLEAATKALDVAEIEYSRYGDTLFEVFFAGGRLATGASLAEGGARLPVNVSVHGGWSCCSQLRPMWRMVGSGGEGAPCTRACAHGRVMCRCWPARLNVKPSPPLSSCSSR